MVFWSEIPQWSGGLANQVWRGHRQDLVVAHLQLDRFPAIKTRGAYPHELAWEQPANRQRLESALGEPLLLAVNADAVLGGFPTAQQH